MTDHCQSATGRRLLTPISGFVSDGLRCCRRFQQPLTPAEQALARATRLHLISATSTTRFVDLARQSPISSYPDEQLRLLNGMYPAGEPVAGQPLKIVR